MKKELRHQIQENEFATGVENATGWATKHGDELKIGVLVVALVALGGFGLQYFRTQRDADANRDFADAISSFEAPVKSELAEGAPAPTLSFATSKEKYEKALGDFEGVGRRHASHAVASRAAYYAALCKMELGNTADAEKDLLAQSARRDAGPLEASLAKLALGELYRRGNQTDKAVDIFRQLADDPAAAVPHDYAMMRLASTLDEARKLPEARASYLKLAEEFPASVYAGEARRRADYLQTAG